MPSISFSVLNKIMAFGKKLNQQVDRMFLLKLDGFLFKMLHDYNLRLFLSVGLFLYSVLSSGEDLFSILSLFVGSLRSRSSASNSLSFAGLKQFGFPFFQKRSMLTTRKAVENVAKESSPMIATSINKNSPNQAPAPAPHNFREEPIRRTKVFIESEVNHPSKEALNQLTREARKAEKSYASNSKNFQPEKPKNNDDFYNSMLPRNLGSDLTSSNPSFFSWQLFSKKPSTPISRDSHESSSLAEPVPTSHVLPPAVNVADVNKAPTPTAPLLDPKVSLEIVVYNPNNFYEKVSEKLAAAPAVPSVPPVVSPVSPLNVPHVSHAMPPELKSRVPTSTLPSTSNLSSSSASSPNSNGNGNPPSSGNSGNGSSSGSGMSSGSGSNSGNNGNNGNCSNSPSCPCVKCSSAIVVFKHPNTPAPSTSASTIVVPKLVPMFDVNNYFGKILTPSNFGGKNHYVYFCDCIGNLQGFSFFICFLSKHKVPLIDPETLERSFQAAILVDLNKNILNLPSPQFAYLGFTESKNIGKLPLPTASTAFKAFKALKDFLKFKQNQQNHMQDYGKMLGKLSLDSMCNTTLLRLIAQILKNKTPST